jgi:hypothetical protein
MKKDDLISIPTSFPMAEAPVRMRVEETKPINAWDDALDALSEI